MDIYERVKALCDSRKIAITALEKELGFGRGTIGKWRRAIPSTKSLSAVADYFNASVYWLLNGDEEKGSRNIPLYEYVSAGPGALMNAVPVGNLELAPPEDGYEYFSVRVKGNSMFPKIADGDVVVARKQNDVSSGEIAVVTVNGDEATVKQIIKSEAGVTLVGLNAADFTPTFYSNEQIAALPINVLGKVIKVVSEL